MLYYSYFPVAVTFCKGGMAEKKFIIVESKRTENTKTWVLMSDFVNGVILPIRTDKPCFWCREPFSESPIGIPMRFHKDRKSGVYAERMKTHFKQYNLPTDYGNEYFETDGIFCSFGCCKAFVLDALPREFAKYRKSLGLLTLLHEKLTGSLEKIEPAPSWRLLKKWGGKLTIEEFRANYGLKRYEITSNTKRPYMYCTGRYVEERDI